MPSLPKRAPLGRSTRALLAALVFFGVAGRARGQPLPSGEPPSRGPEIPAPALTTTPEATAVVLSPANLAFLPSWNVQGLYTWLDDKGVRGPGGAGLYAGTRLSRTVPWLDRIGVGAALEWVRPPETFAYRDDARLTLALAFRPFGPLSLGAAWSHVFLGENPGASEGLDSLTVSAVGRLGRFVGLGLTVLDTNAPDYNGLPLQRVYWPEVLVRPLGDERLELSGSVKIGERRGDVVPLFRLSGSPTPGLWLRGALAYVRDLNGDGVPENDFQATAGLEIDFAHFGFGGYALFGSREVSTSGAPGSLPDGSYFHGLSFLARVSGDRYRSLYRPSRLVRIDLPKGDDRALTRTLARLDELCAERRVEGVLLVMGAASGGWASMEELRQAIVHLRLAGKHVYVYSAELDSRSYLAASAADRIFLDPAGEVSLVGPSATSFYFKRALDRFKVKADFVRIGRWKTAPEQLTRETPSAEATLVRDSLFDQVWQRLVATVADARKLSPAAAEAAIGAGPDTPAQAKKLGLVDDVKEGDDVEDAISGLLGHPVSAELSPSSPARPIAYTGPAIAVIHVEGDLVDGTSRTIPILDVKLAGHQTILAAIDKARADPRVKAIVLRVSSPGGSALASDLIARELRRTEKLKPVVCSFGDVAASGGYYVSGGCGVVYADPSTVTGSIGIFSGKVDLSGLAEWIGVNPVITKRGAHADTDSLFRPYTDEERAAILGRLRYYYDRFVDTVAAARKLTPAQVDALGRGRVWSGAQAKERKLVDHLGGFLDAVREAKQLAGLAERTKVELVDLPPEPQGLVGQLVQLFGVRAGGTPPVLELPRAVVRFLRALPASVLAEPDRPMARLDPEVAVP